MSRLRIHIYSDGADIETMVSIYESGQVDGFTTNPTLMRRAGVTDYEAFARAALDAIPDAPISFEVLADDWATIESQARAIATWGQNVFVKVPVVNTKSESAAPTIRALSGDGVKLNVTAIMTVAQSQEALEAVAPGTQAILSVFAGRIANTGRDPIPIMRQVVKLCEGRDEVQVLWASPREVLNVYQAEECGCDIITMTPNLSAQLALRDKDLDEFSRETVQMFYDDARSAGYTISALTTA